MYGWYDLSMICFRSCVVKISNSLYIDFKKWTACAVLDKPMEFPRELVCFRSRVWYAFDPMWLRYPQMGLFFIAHLLSTYICYTQLLYLSVIVICYTHLCIMNLWQGICAFVNLWIWYCHLLLPFAIPSCYCHSLCPFVHFEFVIGNLWICDREFVNLGTSESVNVICYAHLLYQLLYLSVIVICYAHWLLCICEFVTGNLWICELVNLLLPLAVPICYTQLLYLSVIVIAMPFVHLWICHRAFLNLWTCDLLLSSAMPIWYAQLPYLFVIVICYAHLCIYEFVTGQFLNLWPCESVIVICYAHLLYPATIPLCYCHLLCPFVIAIRAITAMSLLSAKVCWPCLLLCSYCYLHLLPPLSRFLFCCIADGPYLWISVLLDVFVIFLCIQLHYLNKFIRKNRKIWIILLLLSKQDCGLWNNLKIVQIVDCKDNMDYIDFKFLRKTGT